MTLPYPLPALAPGAPLDRHRGSVEPGWIDANGHMNVGYYLVAFDRATDTFCEELGVAWNYVEHALGMIFVLEAHVTYERELHRDDPFRVSTQLLAHDAKRAQIFHVMRHADAGWTAATNELMMIHVDFATRKSTPWRPETVERLEAMSAAHRALPRPEKAGRSIGLPPRRD